MIKVKDSVWAISQAKNILFFVKISLDKWYSISYIVGVMNKHINKPDEKDFFTVDEAAKELGIKTTAIRNYLYEEMMTTYKFKTLTLLSKVEVEEWKKRQK